MKMPIINERNERAPGDGRYYSISPMDVCVSVMKSGNENELMIDGIYLWVGPGVNAVTIEKGALWEMMEKICRR